jgi:hypothetical protein
LLRDFKSFLNSFFIIGSSSLKTALKFVHLRWSQENEAGSISIVLKLLDTLAKMVRKC